MRYIYDYITLGEYRCHHCEKLPPDFSLTAIDGPFRNLFHKFKNIRSAWGEPIDIVSGYRCPFHNHEIGGSLASVHPFGLAFDLRPRDREVKELYKHILLLHPELRIGEYSTHVHIDNGYLIKPRMSSHWQEGARWQE